MVTRRQDLNPGPAHLRGGLLNHLATATVHGSEACYTAFVTLYFYALKAVRPNHTTSKLKGNVCNYITNA